MSAKARTLSLSLILAFCRLIFSSLCLCLCLCLSLILLLFALFLHLFQKVIFFFDWHQNQFSILSFISVLERSNLALLFVKFCSVLSIEAFTGFPMSFKRDVLFHYPIKKYFSVKRILIFACISFLVVFHLLNLLTHFVF